MFIHLTNFSVNKAGQVPTDYPPGCQVNKWTIYELWEYLNNVDGIDPTPFWDGVKDVVIKTLLCGHERIDKMMKESASSFYNNFNLLGLDIFIDADLKPYLLEVNTIPSLFINQVSKEVDTNLKAPLIAETFNICGHHLSAGLATKHRADIIKHHLPDYQGSNLGYDHRIYCNVLSPAEKLKHEMFAEGKRNGFSPTDSPSEEAESDYESDYEEEEEADISRSVSVSSTEPETSDGGGGGGHGGGGGGGGEKCPTDILADLTPCDVRVLLQSEEELSQTQTFERIFPTAKTSHYLQFTSCCNYYDNLLSSWEQKYSGAREEGIAVLKQCCQQKIHLQVPQSEERMTMPQKSPVLYKRNLKVPHIFEKR